MLSDASRATHAGTGFARPAGASSKSATMSATAPARNAAVIRLDTLRSSRGPYWMSATMSPATIARSHGDMRVT